MENELELVVSMTGLKPDDLDLFGDTAHLGGDRDVRGGARARRGPRRARRVAPLNRTVRSYVAGGTSSKRNTPSSRVVTLRSPASSAPYRMTSAFGSGRPASSTTRPWMSPVFARFGDLGDREERERP